jgi:hypothetical protein
LTCGDPAIEQQETQVGNERFPTCRKSIDGESLGVVPGGDGFEGGEIFRGVERGDEGGEEMMDGGGLYLAD